VVGFDNLSVVGFDNLLYAAVCCTRQSAPRR
jgi:hypothetical protein